MRMIFIALFFVLPTALFSQERDSVFSGYDDYSNYVDEMIMKRDFIPLIQTLGGRDEYTDEQLVSVNGQLLAAFPSNFRNSNVFRQEDLGGNVKQEARIYWNGESYAFFYAIFHERKNDLVVLNFNLNSNVATIMSKF